MTDIFEPREDMETVVRSLEADPRVVLVGGEEFDDLQNEFLPGLGWSRILDVYLHPVDPTYNPDGLNDLMHSLVPEVWATKYEKFSSSLSDGSLRLGNVSYEETIGVVRVGTTVIINKGVIPTREGKLDSRWSIPVEEKDIRQRTWVHLMPDIGHVADAVLLQHHRRIIVADQLVKSQLLIGKS